MTPKLTAEQREALSRQGSPVAIEDEQTRRVYFLVDPAMLESLREQADMAAILQGVADAESGRVQPLDEAFRQIEGRVRARFGK
jgi:predicted transcriptional regulator